ncbi:cell wall-binding protein YocH precursor [Clostridium acetireducens DSM 10703]|jgi:uncharacterized protein YabE (DUF348 family)|uniref:Cell wall-binding protein YocH n=1 Tax=Clostridium acetireducens DSM 10703 TaxID=1121290 RepID=A0A1E8EXJ2_9CLOT|nr:3D domain-containing protein [Clostridium acetireducens]OFI05492.1 cell wall-binding protein YocH precursor [Clostridium acetireducens DSM 10703]
MVEKLKKYFSYGPKAIFVFVLIMLSVTVFIFNTRKTITVSIDNKKIEITTFRDTYRKALTANNIIVGPKDKASPSLDSKIKDKTKIVVKRAVDLTVKVDGKNLKVKSAERNVANMLKAEKIALKGLDRVYPSKNSEIKEGMKVAITRVESKVITEDKPISYSTVVNKDDGIEEGKKVVKQEGQDGKKSVSTRVIYENGKEVSRKIIKEIVTKKPTDKIVALGTLGVYRPSRGGDSIQYNKVLNMRATAYTSDYASTGKNPGDYDFGITATGTVARRSNSGYSSVAVDPRIIPLGTKLYIEGYGYAIAEDTGGAIKGNRIDLFFSSKSEVYNWGVRQVNVYILK